MSGYEGGFAGRRVDAVSKMSVRLSIVVDDAIRLTQPLRFHSDFVDPPEARPAGGDDQGIQVDRSSRRIPVAANRMQPALTLMPA